MQPRLRRGAPNTVEVAGADRTAASILSSSAWQMPGTTAASAGATRLRTPTGPAARHADAIAAAIRVGQVSEAAHQPPHWWPQKAKLLRSIERIPHILLSDWIAWVDEEADQRRRGHQVVQKADLLCRESSKQRGQAGGVAPGTVHACDEAARDWILAGKENNRDITSGALCSARRRRARSEDCNPATGQ